MTTEKRLWGLFHRRPCLVPSWRGWLALVVILGILGIGFVRHAHSFLAVTEPLPGGLLVVEGWAPDYALDEAAAEFKRNRYERLYVIGGPVQWGAPLAEYKTYAERGAAVLLKLGLTTNEVQGVPAPEVRQDRTYAAAVALRNWLKERGAAPTKVHLISEGPHARRSRLLLRRVFGKEVQVGVTAVPLRDYDAAHWWRSSGGVRSVISELLAYAYTRLLFRAEP